MNTHVEGMESNSQSNFGMTKPVDWRGFFYFFYCFAKITSEI